MNAKRWPCPAINNGTSLAISYTQFTMLKLLGINFEITIFSALAEILKEAKTNVVVDSRGLSKCPASAISHGMTNLTDCGKAEVELFSEANTDVLQNGK